MEAARSTRVDLESARIKLLDFARALDGSHDFAMAMATSAVTLESKRAVLRDLIELAELEPILGSFVMLALEDGRIGYLHPIAEEFDRMALSARGGARARLICARELDDKRKERFRAAIESMSGGASDLEFALDRSIIGGVIIELGDRVYDGSVRGALISLRRPGSFARADGSAGKQNLLK